MRRLWSYLKSLFHKHDWIEISRAHSYVYLVKKPDEEDTENKYQKITITKKCSKCNRIKKETLMQKAVYVPKTWSV